MSRDDRRFRPASDDDDEYAVGDDYAPAPPPGSADPTDPPRATPPVSPSPERELPDPAAATEPAAPATPALPYATPIPIPPPGAATPPGGPPSGATPPAGPPSGAAPPGPSPYIPSPAGGPSPTRKRTSAQVGCAVAVAFFALMAVIVIVIGAIAGNGDGDDDAAATPPGVDSPPDLDVAWIRYTDDIAAGVPAVSNLLPTTDGSFGGDAVLDAGSTWLIRFGNSAGEGRLLVAVDPATGETAWETTFDDALDIVCDARAADATVICLSEGADGAYTGHVLDAATGTARTSWPAPGVTSVALIHLTGDGVIVVGDADPAPHARLAFLGLDGVERWSLDVADLENADLLFDDFLAQDFSDEPTLTMERTRWRDLPEGHVLLWSTPGVALIDTASGAVVVHECLRATAQGEAYYCVADDGVQRRGLDGSVVWTTPGVDLAFPADVGHHDPIAINDQAQLFAFDTETGTLGDVLYDVDPATDWLGPSALGNEEWTVVETPRTLVGVATGSTTAAWTYDATDRIWDTVLVGDAVVVDTSGTFVGLDAATGDVLWERGRSYDNTGYNVQGIGDDLVLSGLDGLTAYDLP
ncbi:Pyrrolo-quinoline quinone [Beutenbergia cavernae DSM 12333]|uniref:Pyrrolo-quinoline quinone n=1 Tax=Beutenbergia cavernae (strain ATCC BAA-8 / DSM 12333 / CCUG 43141 / JCM 11478 / NBRC 16432 / NCIMB 13614 / HKI 0122) TaxID=471853 RepID=C5C4D8_BEUC1|nr:PQQ-binding-like beta-propeller repeat protein [Beutenbergia cavernae]ACQ82062.1 Pyrrolo-quinoline quinone [Beutenbergia cavernae DSM 12333]